MEINKLFEYKVNIYREYESFKASITEGAALLIESTKMTAPIILEKMSDWVSMVPLKEICFSGDLAAEFEDAADEFLEDGNHLDTPTSAFESHNDACEHFLFAAGYSGSRLVVFAETTGELEVALMANLKA
ncbi:hypothetical protein [Asticcacaulis sp. YBE204]|uniref:hypothetical protein n=1 Tax=Asticcacaulis sp. YBE204 TaxID=1282363 RepID=UPI0003C3AD39|nr:hypothetical protein [Asticcacaulis sp. YBE204]ESQ76549.1 hypothetical protein AEYBE204_19350 [Asticcacaulis sp. YBE204]